MTGPLDPTLQIRLKILGATDEEVARLGSLNSQHAIDWDALFALLAADHGFLARLLSVFAVPTSPVRPGP